MARNDGRKRSQRALGGDEQRFRLVMDAVRDFAVVLLDPDGCVVDWNEGAERLLGYRPEEIVGQSFARFFTPGDRERDRPSRELEEAARTGRAEDDNWVMRKDGSRFWGSGVTSALRDEAGRLRGFAKIVRDLTERNLAQEERERLLARERAARAEAEAAHARLQTILQSAAHGILYVERATRRLIANPEAARLFGRPFHPEAGAAQYVGQVYHPDGRRMTAEELPSSRALQGQTLQDEELLVVRPDGTRVPVLESAAPVRNPEGHIMGAVVVFQNIAAMKELARLREEWISVIAHDLRQPVTTITGYAGLLARLAEQRGAPAQEKRGLEHIRAAAQNLNKMIGDLLDISRLEAGRLELDRQAVDLAMLVREVVERTRAITAGHPVHLETTESLPLVWADPARIEQVLGNLLSNAAKYGYRNMEIAVAVEHRHGEVQVAVTNSGPGIPPDELPRLFTRFHRTRAAKRERTPGLGLGLYISRGLVEAHGGRIWAESTPGNTTTFRFTLPAVEARA